MTVHKCYIVRLLPRSNVDATITTTRIMSIMKILNALGNIFKLRIVKIDHAQIVNRYILNDISTANTHMNAFKTSQS